MNFIWAYMLLSLKVALGGLFWVIGMGIVLLIIGGVSYLLLYRA